MRFFKVSLVALLLVVQAPVLFAVSAELVSYKDALLVKESVEESVRSRVVLSAVNRASNALRIEHEKWIEGARQNWLFKLNDSVDNLLVFDYYLAMTAKHGTVEFSCKERACGTSSDWANKLFGESLLTGRDSNQYYMAGTVNLDGKAGWLSAYVVQNGRRHNYVFVQFVEDSAIRLDVSDVIGVVDVGFDKFSTIAPTELLSFFNDGKQLQIGIYGRYIEGMRKEDWQKKALDARVALETRLDVDVPNWRSRASIVIGTPQSKPPVGVAELLWFTFVSFSR
jgi:Domain of unknown function (DUF4892)